MKFVIRDDDLNFFSKPADINFWYKDIFHQRIPVGFAIVPFAKKTSDIYTGDYGNPSKEYPISDNLTLINYIKNNDLIEVLQHGCTHETKNGVFEYSRKYNLLNDTVRGNRELEKSFNRKIRIFVAPHDRISNHGISAIESLGLNLIRGRGSKNFILRKNYFFIFPMMIFRRIRYPIKTMLPAYPYVLDFGKHKEAYSYRLEDNNLEELFGKLEYAKRKNGNFIIVNHLHSFNNKRRLNLMKLIERAKKNKFKFIYPSNLFGH